MNSNEDTLSQTARKHKSFLRRLVPHHEHWPWWMLVAPFWPFWLWYGIRLRCATWFTTVNPGIEDGGFMGESKKAIQNIIPLDVQPRTFYIDEENSFEEIKARHDLEFPFIAKPDIGGRGRRVEVIKNKQDLENYNSTMDEHFMLQEMIHYPLELGVFFTKLPNEENGQVTSITSKGFLNVKGDGVATVQQLMQSNERAKNHTERIMSFLDINRVPREGEVVLLEPIGNHVLGTKFINESHRITDQIHEVFNKIVSRIDGFYYGRFDLKVSSWEDLSRGKNIMILELNGLTSDVTHIFDPQFRTRDVFAVQYKHIKIAFEIAKQNLKKGTRATPVIELAKKTWGALRMM
jgi:hypothetical protein